MFVKAPDLVKKTYGEQVLLFAPHTGQTHCLDNNIIELFKQLEIDQPKSLSQLNKYFLQDCANEEKTMLSTYIQAMIDNLLELKLIYTYNALD